MKFESEQDDGCPSIMDMGGMVKHPTAREILDFRVGGAGSVSAPEPGGHIASCDRCHAIYRGALYIEGRIPDAFTEGTPGVSCPEDWEIAAVIASEIGGHAAIRISSHVQGCLHCVDRAARYHKVYGDAPPGLKVPESWRNAAVRAIENDPGEAREIGSGLLDRLRGFIEGLTAELPPLPGYAAAVVAIVLIAWLYTGDRKKAIIIPSTEKIAFRETGPTGSLGFMEQKVPRLPAKGMDLRGSGNTVFFRWEPPEGYSGYSFSLVEKHSGNIMWSRPDVRGAEVVVPGDLFADDKVYAWLIEVALADGRKIEYTGDFLYRK